MDETAANRVREMARELREYATCFVPRDWNYTRNLGDLNSIRFNYELDRRTVRVKRAVRWLFRGKTPSAWGLGPQWRMALYALRRDRHLPDGVLDGGSILTYWEETGEYLQYVQPSVGVMIADWMDAEPDSLHARRIAAEMWRIQDAYAKRIAHTQEKADE